MFRSAFDVPGTAAAARVSSGTHDELKQKYDHARAALGERANENAALEAAMPEAQAKSERREAEIAEARERMAALAAAAAKAERAIARLSRESGSSAAGFGEQLERVVETRRPMPRLEHDRPGRDAATSVIWCGPCEALARW